MIALKVLAATTAVLDPETSIDGTARYLLQSVELEGAHGSLFLLTA
jgi:hypothetical protein